jgi:hypothetical protein
MADNNIEEKSYSQRKKNPLGHMKAFENIMNILINLKLLSYGNDHYSSCTNYQKQNPFGFDFRPVLLQWLKTRQKIHSIGCLVEMCLNLIS